MADVKTVDIDGSQWSMKDQEARDKIAELETSVLNDNTYSTEEIKTSKIWIDGKPIYRRVFYKTNFIDKVTMGNLGTYDTIVSCRAIITILQNGDVISDGYGNNNVGYIVHRNGDIDLLNIYSVSKASVIVEYTK